MDFRIRIKRLQITRARCVWFGTICMIRLFSASALRARATHRQVINLKQNKPRYVSDYLLRKLVAADAESTSPMMAQTPTQKALGFDDGPLVWVDLELTGLDVHKDEIMEIAVLITDGNLALVDDGIQYVIKVEKETLDKMGEWCTRQHASTGLTQACLESHHALPEVESIVLDYIHKYVPEKRVGVLAGNSVHVDKEFLVERMPKLLDHLHYRIVDVSSIKELCRRWYGTVAPPMVLESDAHRALDDIRGSIKELQWYRGNIFVNPESFVPPSNSTSTSRTA